jgi:DNA replication and repair protein RecF
VEIQERRRALIGGFNQVFTPLYEEVADIPGVHLVYGPSWKPREKDTPVTVEEGIAQLRDKRDLDLRLGTTMSGPHRDRITFVQGGRAFVPDASTGQKRLAAILLRSAQGVYYRNRCGKKPVLLLDDVLLELDPEKRRRVRSVLPPYDQLFCTFLPGDPYDRDQTPRTRIYRITNGAWENPTDPAPPEPETPPAQNVSRETIMPDRAAE